MFLSLPVLPSELKMNIFFFLPQFLQNCLIYSVIEFSGVKRVAGPARLALSPTLFPIKEKHIGPNSQRFLLAFCLSQVSLRFSSNYIGTWLFLLNPSLHFSPRHCCVPFSLYYHHCFFSVFHPHDN